MSQDISEEVADILRTAVTVAKVEQIRRLPTLKARLQQLFPGKENSISEAIQYWADHTA